MGSIQQYNNTLYCTAGENIVYLNLESGKSDCKRVPEFKTDTKEMKAPKVSESKNITCVSFSKCGDYTVVATENKHVIVFDKNFETVRHFTANRNASKVCFTPSNDILVADKSGDVYLYEQKSDNKGTLLFGHRSVILDLIVSNCGKYVITCDRDEKIRVSSFPNCYNIVSYCLGHSEFVTKIKLLTDEVLVSASGDGTVRFWRYIAGEEIEAIDTNRYIEDKNLLDKFASRFAKTEIFALPVSDMDLHFADAHYLAVSIFGCNLIQLYKVNSQNLDCTYLRKFVIEEPFQFSLSNNLFIFANNIMAFSYLSADYVKLDLNILENFSDKYKEILKLQEDDSINALYKRKFDNVQEYLERKKQRIEIK